MWNFCEYKIFLTREKSSQNFLWAWHFLWPILVAPPSATWVSNFNALKTPVWRKKWRWSGSISYSGPESRGNNFRQMSTKFVLAEKSWEFNASKQYLAKIKREAMKKIANTDFAIFTPNSKKSNLVKKWGHFLTFIQQKRGNISPSNFLRFVGDGCPNKLTFKN